LVLRAILGKKVNSLMKKANKVTRGQRESKESEENQE